MGQSSDYVPYYKMVTKSDYCYLLLSRHLEKIRCVDVIMECRDKRDFHNKRRVDQGVVAKKVLVVSFIFHSHDP